MTCSITATYPTHAQQPEFVFESRDETALIDICKAYKRYAKLLDALLDLIVDPVLADRSRRLTIRTLVLAWWITRQGAVVTATLKCLPADGFNKVLGAKIYKRLNELLETSWNTGENEPELVAKPRLPKSNAKMVKSTSPDVLVIDELLKDGCVFPSAVLIKPFISWNAGFFLTCENTPYCATVIYDASNERLLVSYGVTSDFNHTTSVPGTQAKQAAFPYSLTGTHCHTPIDSAVWLLRGWFSQPAA